jgi:putative peptidoglycan lipid II flippase
VRRLLGRFRPSLDVWRASVRQVLRGFGPVVVGRGVVQVSAYVDTYYASLISDHAFSILAYAQVIYLLPVSLFGMSVSAAELTEMSRAHGSSEEVAAKLRERIDGGLRRIAFFVIPSVAALLFLGDVVGGAIIQNGGFGPGDTRMAWYVMMGAAVGLLASTSGRLYSSGFYALRDTRTPLYFSIVRVILTAVLAYWSVTQLPGLLGVPDELGMVGITGTTGLVAWLEFELLRRTLNRRIGQTGLKLQSAAPLWVGALLAAAVGLAVKVGLVHLVGAAPQVLGVWGGQLVPAPSMRAWLAAPVILLPFGLAYFGVTAMLGVPEARALLRRALRRRWAH